MRKREYKCVDGKIHVLESPRISISNSEYDAFGLEYDTATEKWVKVAFDTATLAGEWVDKNKDPNVYRLPRSMEIQAIAKSLDLYKNFSMSNEFPAFDGLSDGDLVKAKPNIMNMVKFMAALEESNIIAVTQMQAAVARLNLIEEVSK